MKLRIQKRAAERKSEAKRERREGRIPAILYSRNQNPEAISVERNAFEAVLRQLKQGRLSTVKFTLVDEAGKERSAIVKEIQYHVTSYDIIHLDFEELHADIPVNVNVPIEVVGGMECPGVKLGGVVREVIRKIRVRGLPKDIPNHLELDIRDLNMGGTKRLSDLSIPEALRPLANLDEVAIAIVKR